MMPPFLHAFPRRVVVFNPTGRYATRQVAGMQEAGTPVVAGIALGKGGGTLDGLPLLDSLRALDAPADAAILYTPPEGTGDAIRQCAAAGIPTIVAAAEYVPLHDTLRAAQAAAPPAAGWWGRIRWGSACRGKGCWAPLRHPSACRGGWRCWAAAVR
ncbi:CoA-binding protein [Pseudoroseomonas wenyumeiae]